MEQIMSIPDIGNLFNQYGGLTIICILAVWVFISTFLHHRETEKHKEEITKKEEEMQLARQKMENEQDIRQQKILNDLIEQKLLGTSDHSHEDKENNALNMKIDNFLEKSLEATGADRISLYMYHNGGKDYLGRSFQKMSCTNQAVKGMIPSTRIKLVNVFRNTIWTIYSSLVEKGQYNILDISTYKDIDPGMYQTYVADGIKATFGYNVVNQAGYVIGYVSFSYAETKTKEEADQIVHSIKKVKSTLEGLLYAKE